MSAFLRRQRPASMIVAIGALVLAIGGTAFAGKLISGKKIKNESITGLDVKDESLSPADFSGSVKGDQGPPGPRGLQGPAGPVALHYVESGVIGAAANDQTFGSVDCPAGESVTGGGVLPDGDSTAVSVNSTYPGDNPSDADFVRDDRWSVYVNNTTGSVQEFTVYAVCVEATEVG